MEDPDDSKYQGHFPREPPCGRLEGGQVVSPGARGVSPCIPDYGAEVNVSRLVTEQLSGGR